MVSKTSKIMEKDITGNVKNNNPEDNTAKISLDYSNSYFLTIKNDFKKAVEVKSSLNYEPFKFQNCNGTIKFLLKMGNIQFAAVTFNDNQKIENVIEVKLFDQNFKGIIVNYEYFVREINHVEYLKNTKFIDTKKFCEIRIINNDSDEKNGKYIKIKHSNPPIYAICLQRVHINGVKCMEIKMSILSDDPAKQYVKIIDIEVIDNLPSLIQYHNLVIIKPEFILKIETFNTLSSQADNFVQFRDSNLRNFQGSLLWSGKLNDTYASIVSLKEDQWTEDILPYKFNETTMQTAFQIKDSGICVVQMVLNRDVISYITCKETNLEVVDPKFKYSFQKEHFDEKMLIFKLGEMMHIVTLKWKGLIYNQLCLGCELSYESKEGSDGTYGTEKLFDCAPKKGLLITAEKVNHQNIKNLCEFSGHRSLQFIFTTNGYQIYDKASICCIEKLDKIDLGKKNLKIGCKIMYQGNFIGKCIFIGKVNNRPSVGIELNLDLINEKPIVFDYMYYKVFNHGKLCFLDLETVDIGTFYRTDNSQEIFVSSSSDFTKSLYYPGNNRHKEGLIGEVKWIGKHENGNEVCGIDLESDVDSNFSNYPLEKLFSYKDNHGIIDDSYKFESHACAETENSFRNQSSGICFKDILKCLLKNGVMSVHKDLIDHLPSEFIDFLKKDKETMVNPENLNLIIDALYKINKIEEIDDTLKSIENINGMFVTLETLLSKCIEDKKFNFISDILSRITGFEINNDSNDQICLSLAIKCLENMKEFGSTEVKPNLESIYELLIGLCKEPKCFIVNGILEETFITKIILNKSISENILIEVLKSGKFNINQKNSNKKLPMELAIDNCQANILNELFNLNCDTDELKNIYDRFISKKEHLTKEEMNILRLMKEQLEKISNPVLQYQ